MSRPTWRRAIATMTAALPILISSYLIAGCASQKGTQSASNTPAVQLTHVVVATLVEPAIPPATMPGMPLGPGWYSDSHTGGAGMQFIFSCPITTPLEQRLSLPDVKALAAAGKPQWWEVLNGTYLPDPYGIALQARLAMLVGPNDLGSLQVLQALEAKGHALAEAWAANPAQARELSSWMMECHRESINIVAARAARGDAVAQRAMDMMSARLRASPVGPAAIEATNALVAAQHYMRLRIGLMPEANNAFWVLRTPSFAEALDNVAVTQMALRQVSFVRCKLIGLPWCGDMQWQPQRRAACFPLESVGKWNRRELDVHRASCAG